MTQGLPKISLCMIAKDEEAWIASAISSVKPIVSEIILVDTGSTDNTVAIAEKFGAKVYHQPWADNFSVPRNLSLEKATGDWILVLDADEAIAERDHAALVSLTLSQNSCYHFKQRHYSDDPRMSGFVAVKGQYPEWEKNYGGYFESGLVRLFPNKRGIHYRGVVHELVEHAIKEMPDLSIEYAQIPLHHYGHTAEVKAQKNKTKIYAPLGRAKLGEKPSDWKAHFELAVELNCSGKFEESLASFEESIRLNPKNVQSYVNMGYALCQLQRFESGVQVLARGLEIDPRCADAHCNLGVLFLRMGKYPLAEKHFRCTFHLKPSYINAYWNLGQTLAKMGRYSEAVYYIKRSLELFPKNSDAKADLGAIYFACRDYDLGEKYLLQALDENPELLRAKQALEQLYKVTRQNDEAAALLRQLVADPFDQADPSSPNQPHTYSPKNP